MFGKVCFYGLMIIASVISVFLKFFDIPIDIYLQYAFVWDTKNVQFTFTTTNMQNILCNNKQGWGLWLWYDVVSDVREVRAHDGGELLGTIPFL